MAGGEPRATTAGMARGEPSRRCLVTGAVRPKAELIRFVVDPDGKIMADVSESLPGRGLWLSAEREILKKACSRRLFAKAARATVQVPDGLVGEVEEALVRRCMSLIGLARRAGQAVIGYERVREWLATKRVGLLLAACDGAPTGQMKLQALAAGVPIATGLRAEELGAAAGRSRAVHVALAPGRLAERLHRDMVRLAGVRTGLEPGRAGGTRKRHER